MEHLYLELLFEERLIHFPINAPIIDWETADWKKHKELENLYSVDFYSNKRHSKQKLLNNIY